MPRKAKAADRAVVIVQNETVKKHVAAIHMSGELSFLGRKMVNVLLLNAYDDLLTRRTHKLPVPYLLSMLGWDGSQNVDDLKDVLMRLASTPVEFNVMEDGKETWRVMSMISFGEIKGGVCTYRYDEYLAERLYDPEVYATISIGMQRRFDGGYALTLYENCLRYKDVGSTGWWDIGRFRKIVGATAPMYDEFKYLKREVIAKPVEEINRVSDIRVTPEYRKEGRKVTAVRFLVSESPQRTLLKPEATDDYGALRESETFKRLREHGIGERLAIAWLIEDEERVKAIVSYTEEKARKKQVKGTTAGYIRSLVENPEADIGSKTAYEKKKEEQKRAEEEAAAAAAALEKAKAEQAKADALRTLEAFGALSESDQRAARAAFADAQVPVIRKGWEKELAATGRPEESPKYRGAFVQFLKERDIV